MIKDMVQAPMGSHCSTIKVLKLNQPCYVNFTAVSIGKNDKYQLNKQMNAVTLLMLF